MDRFVALYRGINVGGNNPVKMQALRALHERLGHREVATYIQSGNVVFAAKGTAEAIARKIAAAFKEEFAFAPRVMVVPAPAWRALLRANPYAAQAARQPKTVHAGVCEGEPSAAGLKALLQKTGGSETFALAGALVYLHAPDGLGTSKFAVGMEKACGVPMTVRNWRTIEAIGKMLEAE